MQRLSRRVIRTSCWWAVDAVSLERCLTRLVLTELHPGGSVTVDQIRAKTGVPFEVALKAN